MTPLFSKLNHKGQTPIVVLDAPASFDEALEALTGIEVRRRVGRGQRVAFAIAFATTQKALDAASATLSAAAEGDAIIWIAYPKGTSKRYTCEFNRDSGWTVLGAAGFEPVRGVAIDEDWSALRFRRVEHIASFTRAATHAVSVAGKQRAAQTRTAKKR